MEDWEIIHQIKIIKQILDKIYKELDKFEILVSQRKLKK